MWRSPRMPTTYSSVRGEEDDEYGRQSHGGGVVNTLIGLSSSSISAYYLERASWAHCENLQISSAPAMNMNWASEEKGSSFAPGGRERMTSQKEWENTTRHVREVLATSKRLWSFRDFSFPPNSQRWACSEDGAPAPRPRPPFLAIFFSSRQTVIFPITNTVPSTFKTVNSLNRCGRIISATTFFSSFVLA